MFYNVSFTVTVKTHLAYMREQISLVRVEFVLTTTNYKGTLWYQPEDRGFASFFFKLILPAHNDPVFDSVCRRKKVVPGIFLGSKPLSARKADSLTAICEPIV
jgi:hypothetical protein